MSRFYLSETRTFTYSRKEGVYCWNFLTLLRTEFSHAHWDGNHEKQWRSNSYNDRHNIHEPSNNCYHSK